MRIAVLGVGLIGGSIGLAARARVEGATVVGFGRSAERLACAKELGAVDEVAETLEQALEGASACFCCAPVGALPGQIAEALAVAGEDCVITDAGSIKHDIVAAIDDPRFVGGHPIAGAETAGVEHARADLFEGACWYLTPSEQSSGILFERLHRLIAAFGARPAAIDSESHDRLLATVSHLPHVLANVLVAQAAAASADESERMPEVGRSFRDSTRVAGANPAIWADIFATNSDAVAEEIDDVVDRLRQAAELLRAGDARALAEWHHGAFEDRRALLESEGAGGPLEELRVVVDNRPGTVAEIALALGEAGVNIEDMALDPAADMQTGAITLWIAGTGAARRAAEVVRGLGHSASALSRDE
jgi:prephenate dehydrogenase